MHRVWYAVCNINIQNPHKSIWRVFESRPSGKWRCSYRQKTRQAVNNHSHSSIINACVSAWTSWFMFFSSSLFSFLPHTATNRSTATAAAAVATNKLVFYSSIESNAFQRKNAGIFINVAICNNNKPNSISFFLYSQSSWSNKLSSMHVTSHRMHIKSYNTVFFCGLIP